MAIPTCRWKIHNRAWASETPLHVEWKHILKLLSLELCLIYRLKRVSLDLPVMVVCEMRANRPTFGVSFSNRYESLGRLSIPRQQDTSEV